jgi:hypothetical protein
MQKFATEKFHVHHVRTLMPEPIEDSNG